MRANIIGDNGGAVEVEPGPSQSIWNIRSKIEANRSTLKILFVFNLVDTTEFASNPLVDWTFIDYLINCQLKTAIAYNSATDEIYWKYK